jgi:hexosaminidase
VYVSDEQRSPAGCIDGQICVLILARALSHSKQALRMSRSIAVAAAVVVLASCAKRSVTTVAPTPPVAHGSSIRQVIPQPRSAVSHEGPGFTITADTVIVASRGDEDELRIARVLSDFIGLAAAPRPPRVEVAGASVPSGAISLELGGFSGGEEAYELIVEPGAVRMRARQAAGLFYAVQTFRQLLPAFVEHEAVRPNTARPVSAPAGHISDEPRFPWRGAMLDVARHFFAVNDVKRYLDLMALYKLNRLHLHLADDQGWRIDITSWPNLALLGGRTQVGGGAGGYYSQAEYADLVRYAADRFITIVPEIDMPGHTNAALASYAELNCDGVARQPFTGIEVGFSALCVDKEVTYRFIDDVVREVAALTPGPWFHIGGDEVKTLTAEQYLRFIDRVQTIVRSHGKQLVGWDEIAPAALVPGSIVQNWRPKTSPAEAVAKGARVIMSIANRAYLDMKYDEGTAIGLSWAGQIGVRTAYDWDPAEVATGVTESALMGVEAPLWSETLQTIEDVEFLAFPRLIGLAEVGWTRAEARDWNAFKTRLGAHGPRLTALGVNFYRSPEVPWSR